MTRFLVALFGLAFAQLLPSAAAAAPPPALEVVGKDAGDRPADFRFRLGDTLRIKVAGDLVGKIESEWAKANHLVSLYFDGVRIADLKSPPLVAESGNELLLDFALIRNADDDVSREAWDNLFRREHGYVMTIRPALTIGGELPMGVQSAQPFQFHVAPNSAIWLTLGTALAALVVVYWFLVKHTPMLHDAGTACYSLGKSQMAFWGLLVLLSFVGVWMLTGTMERIPPQVIILLGISGATGLGAMVIGDNKKTGLQSAIADKQAGLAELQQEQQRLQAQPTGAAANAPANQNQLATVGAMIASTSGQIAEFTQRLRPARSHGFWRDICDDGNGLSFHRLQVVMWTLVLGAVFVRTVAQVMSMPEFSETLLSLMGISNATYLGFKIPEKQ